MPNSQITLPLLGAAPTLQPTARPIAVPIGARAPIQRSPLMELANAFGGFNDELRGLLRDTAARADRDAMALGELDAMKTNAAAKMESIDTTLKAAVDARQLDPIRRPRYQEAFSARVGADLAQTGLQSELDQVMSDAIKADPKSAEKMVSDVYSKWASKLRPDDTHMALAFDRTAQGVIAGFRQRVAEGQAAEYRKNSQQAMADEGSEIAFRMATAPAEDLPRLHDQLKVHLDELRKELPKSDVNPFFVTKVAAPAVDKLVQQGKYHEAEQLLDEVDRLDVTGSGGLLGGTAVAKAVFSDLRSRISERSRTARNEEWQIYSQSRELERNKGIDAAGAALNAMQLKSGGTLDPEDRFRMIEEYRQANADKPLLVAGFESAVNDAYEKQDKFRANDRFISDLTVSINTLNKEDLDKAEASLEVHYHAGEVPPQVRTQLRQTIDRLRTLYGAVDEQDFKQAKAALYAWRDPGNPHQLLVNFGSVGTAEGVTVQTQWDELGKHPGQQDDHEEKVTRFFGDVLQSELRALGDPNKVPAEKAKILDRATLTTREFARSLLLQMTRDNKAVEQKKVVQDQANRLYEARISGPFTVSPVFTYEEPGKDGKPKTVRYEPKAKGGGFIQRASPNPEIHGPMAEADHANVYFPAHSVSAWLTAGPEGAMREISMPQLVTDMREGESPEKRNKARDTYAYVKGLLGFTPEEVTNGTTKHGVPFDPAEIDPARISVFRSRAELEKHYNGGKPDDVFMNVGHAVDPANKLKPLDLYLAQSALFTARSRK